jgi:hypothetical protein
MIALLLSIFFADLVTPTLGAPPPDRACTAREAVAVAAAVKAHAYTHGSREGAAFVAHWLDHEAFGCRVEGAEILLFATRCPGGRLHASATRDTRQVLSLSASANPQCMNRERLFTFDGGPDHWL